MVVLLMSSLIMPKSAFAYPDNQDDFYEYIKMLGYPVTLPDGKKANWTTYKNYNVIVWGSQHGRHKNGSLCKNDSEYEYLGYDRKVKDVTNACFPNDDSSGTHPKNWNYISVDGAEKSWSGLDASVEKHIKSSPWTGNGATASKPLFYKDIGSESKVKVEVSPTWRGSGAVYTKNRGSNGKIYYATFVVPPLAGANDAIVDGSFDTNKDTYTIESTDDKVTVNYTVTANAKISGYMQYSHITELKAAYKNNSSKTSGQSTTKLKDSFDLTRDNYDAGTYNLTLEGTVSLKTKFNDNESKKVFKKITLVVKKATQPTMSAKGTTDPGTKKFDKGQTVTDVPVKVTATGTLKGLEDTSKITKYQLLARKEEDKTDVVKEFTGSSAKKLSQSNVFNFTIPKSKIGKNEYTQTFKVQAKAYLNDGNVISSSATVRTIVYPPGVDPTPTEPPEPENPEPANEPPTVTIYGPDTVRAGDNVCLNSTSQDPDGTIESQSWNTPGATGSISGSSGCIIYPVEGDYSVTTTVTDDKGATGSDIHNIEVTPPYPNANFIVTGTLKENRKVTLTDATDTPYLYPVDWSKSYWEIKAKDPSNQQYVRYKGNLTANADKVIDSLFKKQGDYTITLSVTNTAGYSDTYERTIHINEDEKPIADFSTVTTIYRDNVNNTQASIKLTDNSYSPDYDLIGQRIWKYKFDSNNDGNFEDETWQIIDDTNLEDVTFGVNHVGKYLIELDVVEQFAQETIPEFVNDSDYQKGNTDKKRLEEKIVEVKNLAPNVSFQVGKRKTVNLNIGVGGSKYNSQIVQSKINQSLKPALSDENIDLNLNINNVSVNDQQILQTGEVHKLNTFPTMRYNYANGYYFGGRQFSLDSNHLISYLGDYNGMLTLTDLTNGKETSSKPAYKDSSGYYHLVLTNILQLKNKNLFSVGGWMANSDGAHQELQYTESAVRIYDIKSDTWSTEPISIGSRGSSALTQLNDGRVFIGFGTDNKGNWNKDALLYDTATKKITSTSTAHYGGFRSATTLKNGKVLLWGGGIYPDKGYPDLGNNYLIYDPSNDTWTKVPIPQKYVDDTNFYIGTFYLATLEDGTVFLTSKNGSRTWLLDPNKNTIVEGPNLPITGGNFSLTEDNRIIVTRGANSIGEASHDVYEIVFPKKYSYDLPKPDKDDYNFNALIEDKALSNEGIQLINNRLQDTKENFIGMGNDINKSQLESIINSNQKKGQYIDNTNIDNAIQQMSDYIIKRINATDINLQISIGKTDKVTGINELESKINSIIKPTLAEKNINLNLSIKKVQTEGNNGTAPPTWRDLQPPSGYVYTQSYLAPSGYYGSLPFLDYSKYDYYVIAKKTSDNVRWYVHYIDTNGKYNSKTIEDAGPLPTNSYEAMGGGLPADFNIYRKENDSQPFKINYSEDLTFVSYLDDNVINSSVNNTISNELTKNDVDFIGLGTTNNQETFSQLIHSNKDKGTFFDTSEFDIALTNMANYIVERVLDEAGKNEVYVTLGDKISYYTYYHDSENDPKYTINENTGERWRYVHDPNAFENPIGKYNKNNENQDKPVEQFYQTGSYQVIHAERDNPVNDDDRFDNYRMWSKEIDNWTIFVHRKPIANFLFNFNSLDGTYSIKNKAYDLDKQSVDIGYGGGIRYLEYKWREKDGDGIWQDGLPPSPLKRKIYEVKQTVYDFQGASNEVIKTLDATNINQPPVADFIPHPDTVEVDENISFENTSYDVNGDNLTAEWSIRKKGSSDPFSKFSSAYDATKKMTTEGEYEVKLKVTDPFGASDEVTKTVTVNIGNFTSSNISHTNKWTNYYNERNRDLGTFLAGEPFVVTANTSKSAIKVTATFDFPKALKEVPEYFLDDPTNVFPDFKGVFELKSNDNVNWEITAWKKPWIMIPDGTYQVIVETTFKNGATQKDIYNIQILDHILYNKKVGYSNKG